MRKGNRWSKLWRSKKEDKINSLRKQAPRSWNKQKCLWYDTGWQVPSGLKPRQNLDHTGQWFHPERRRNSGAGWYPTARWKGGWAILVALPLSCIQVTCPRSLLPWLPQLIPTTALCSWYSQFPFHTGKQRYKTWKQQIRTGTSDFLTLKLVLFLTSALRQ